MNEKQFKIIDIILSCIKRNNGKCNSDQLTEDIENAGYDYYQDVMHLLHLLQDQDIIRYVGDQGYYYELTANGYDVVAKGYKKWLKKKDKHELEQYYNVIIQNRVSVLAFIISLISLFISIFY